MTVDVLSMVLPTVKFLLADVKLIKSSSKSLYSIPLFALGKRPETCANLNHPVSFCLAESVVNKEIVIFQTSFHNNVIGNLGKSLSASEHYDPFVVTSKKRNIY